MTSDTSDSSAGSAIDREVVEAFAAEAVEALEVIEGALLGVEDQADEHQLHAAFRAMHSMKGNASCLELSDIAEIAHRAEDILDGLRRRTTPLTPAIVTAMLRAVDAVRNAIRNERGAIPNRAQVLAALDEALGAPRPTAKPPRLGEVLVDQKLVDAKTLHDVLELQRQPLGELLVNLGVVEPEVIEQALAVQADLRASASERGVGAPANVMPTQASAEPEARRQGRGDAASVRIDTHKLDALLDHVGELISAVSAVVQHPDIAALELDQFAVAAGQLTRVTGSLHDAAMSLRMVPFGQVSNRMQRLVRDLRIKLGKPVELVIDGEETEVDKTVLEGITDPLVHIVRNAIDHGLETPKARQAAGKPASGTLRITARHQGGEVLIVVSDDGRGIDVDRVRRKAEELGWITPGQAVAESSLLQLLFRPGFSTAEKVSDVSGRGVGMDVVKSNIEALRGRVELATVRGSGTTVSIRLPLTLAIIDAMLVRAGPNVFALPLLAIRESVDVDDGRITRLADGTHIVRLRESILPVWGLERIFGDDAEVRPPSEGLLVLVEHGDATCCVRVDALLGQRQIVIKPLDPYIAEIRGVSGCTVLGTGEICLILDIGQLFNAGVPNVPIDPTRREVA